MILLKCHGLQTSFIPRVRARRPCPCRCRGRGASRSRCARSQGRRRGTCECLPFRTSLRQGGADHGSTRMSVFWSTSSGRSGATVLMAGILSSSPRTRLPDDRYAAFLIMPATLFNASAAAAAVAATAQPYPMEIASGTRASAWRFRFRKTRPAATIGIVAHAEDMTRPRDQETCCPYHRLGTWLPGHFPCGHWTLGDPSTGGKAFIGGLSALLSGP